MRDLDNSFIKMELKLKHVFFFSGNWSMSWLGTSRISMVTGSSGRKEDETRRDTKK